MSDFTDDEDYQLVQLALKFKQSGPQIMWEQLARQMIKSKQTKNALRQRLKTLKRRYGHDLERFPPRYFKKHFPNTNNIQRTCTKSHGRTEHHNRVDTLHLSRRNKCHREHVNHKESKLKSVTSFTRSPISKCLPRSHASTCCQKCGQAKTADPPSSLLLLACVATTTKVKEDQGAMFGRK